MNPFIHAIILFSIPMIVLLIFKQFNIKLLWKYLFVFLIIWASLWLFEGKASAYYPDRSLKNKTRNAYIANANWHTEKAFEEFSLAHEKSWFLPNLSTREKVQKAWLIFIIQVPAATPLQKGIIILIGLLTEYGSACIDEWFDIKELLESAQEHAEMAQFYQDLLGKEN